MAYPYLLQRDRKNWLQIANFDCAGLNNNCFLTSSFINEWVDLPQTYVDEPTKRCATNPVRMRLHVATLGC